jgi:hypothetical protein
MESSSNLRDLLTVVVTLLLFTFVLFFLVQVVASKFVYRRLVKNRSEFRVPKNLKTHERWQSGFYRDKPGASVVCCWVRTTEGGVSVCGMLARALVFSRRYGRVFIPCNRLTNERPFRPSWEWRMSRGVNWVELDVTEHEFSIIVPKKQ